MAESKTVSYRETIHGTSPLPLDVRAVELMASLEVGMMTNRQYLDALKQRPSASSIAQPESLSTD